MRLPQFRIEVERYAAVLGQAAIAERRAPLGRDRRWHPCRARRMIKGRRAQAIGGALLSALKNQCGANCHSSKGKRLRTTRCMSNASWKASTVATISR